MRRQTSIGSRNRQPQSVVWLVVGLCLAPAPAAQAQQASPPSLTLHAAIVEALEQSPLLDSGRRHDRARFGGC